MSARPPLTRAAAPGEHGGVVHELVGARLNGAHRPSEAEARRAPAGARGGAAQLALDLQRAAGNAAFCRMVQHAGGPVLARQGTETPAPPAEPAADQSTPAGRPGCTYPIDDITLFEQRERTWPIFGRSEEFPIWEGSADLGWLGSVEFSVTAGAGAEASLLTAIGPGALRDICLDADPSNATVTGSARLTVPADAGPTLTLTGSLRGAADYLGSIPLAALTGELSASGTANAHPEASVAVEIAYTDGRVTFTATPDLTMALELAFDLDASLAAELFGEEAWRGSWNLASWRWERVWNILGRLTVSVADGVAGEPQLELVADEIALGDVLRSMFVDLIVADEIMGGIRGSSAAGEVPMLDPTAAVVARAAIAANDYPTALDIVVRSLPIDTSTCTITFADGGDQEGFTETDFGPDNAPTGPSRVTIYTPAFATLPLLVTTVMHEYQHVLQHQRGMEPGEFAGDAQAAAVANEVRELEAYLWELENATETGLDNDRARLNDVIERLRTHYDDLGNLDAQRQAQYTERVEAAIARARALASCVANECLTERADPFISRCRKASIRREFPSELLQETLGAIKNGTTAKHKKAWKLLNDNRFKK
jgi:hypothetical protein